MPRIPLVDVKAQYAPLIPQLKDAFADVLESGAFILGPNVKAFEHEAARVPRRAGHHRRRQRDGRDRARARRARHRARRRGHLPGVHVLRHGRVDRAARRDARLRRHRPGDVQPRSRGRRRADHAAHARDHARAPVRPAGAARGARGLRFAADRGRGAGVRRAGHRAEGRRVDVQLLSDEEPLRARRRRTDRRDRRRARRAPAAAALPRLEGEGRRSSWSATTRASTRSMPPRCASSCRTSTSGRCCAARRRSATASSASATSWPRPTTSPATCTTSSSAARPSATVSSRRCVRRRSAVPRTTCRRCICSRR